MKFAGRVIGHAFSGVEAESNVDLYPTLVGVFDLDETEVRCWTLVRTSTKPFWLELTLDCDDIFEIVMAQRKLLLDEKGQVQMEFRPKSSSSPNRDRHISRPPREADANATTALTRAASASSLSAEDDFSPPNSLRVQPGVILNQIEPFTHKKVCDLSDDMLVLSARTKGSISDISSVAVCKSKFEEFAQSQYKEGKRLMELKLMGVDCGGHGKKLDFAIGWETWIGSILPHSQRLRSLYQQAQLAATVRTGKLEQLKSNYQELWKRVTFWIADCKDSESLPRLEMVCDDGVPPFMSPFYFSKEEAVYLETLPVLSPPKLLGHALRDKSCTLQLCAAHDLAPFLEQSFDLSPDFHKTRGFMDEKKAWIAQRQQQLAPAMKNAPTFGAFQIR